MTSLCRFGIRSIHYHLLVLLPFIISSLIYRFSFYRQEKVYSLCLYQGQLPIKLRLLLLHLSGNEWPKMCTRRVFIRLKHWQCTTAVQAPLQPTFEATLDWIFIWASCDMKVRHFPSFWSLMGLECLREKAQLAAKQILLPKFSSQIIYSLRYRIALWKVTLSNYFKLTKLRTLFRINTRFVGLSAFSGSL